MKATILRTDACVLPSYHYLHIHIVQPGPATNPKPPASPVLQTDCSHPAGTTHRNRKLKHTSCMCKHFQNNRTNVWHQQILIYLINPIHRLHLLVGFGPVWAGDVPQVASVLYLIVSNLLILQPHNAVSKLCLIWAERRHTQEQHCTNTNISAAGHNDLTSYNTQIHTNTFISVTQLLTAGCKLLTLESGFDSVELIFTAHKWAW